MAQSIQGHCSCVAELEKVLQSEGQTMDDFIALNFTGGFQEIGLHAKRKSDGKRGRLIVFNYCGICGRKIRE